MKVDAAEAAAMIGEIESTRDRVRQSTFYRVAAGAIIGWGLLMVVGNLATHVWPRSGAGIWVAVNVIGAAATWAFGRRIERQGYAFDRRIFGGLALFFAFGTLWSVVIGHFGPRELCAFWPTLFMFGYTIAGLWLGRAFVALGLGVTALIVLGYLFAGDWFNLYLALVDGGGLVLCGLWMRRA